MNPTYDFTGQVAFITGAAMGMGLATAHAFAQSGASVVLADRDGELAASEAEKIVWEGGIAIGVACDVTDEAQVAAAVDRTIVEYGRLDMAFNNAGIQVPPSDAAEEPAEQFQRVVAVNQFGVWATDPKGGVYYVSSDFKTVLPVLPNLAMANGIALSPDGKMLWATEFGRNLLHRIELSDATTIAAIGSAIPYRFTGPAPDSMRVDADGNVYVAIYGQGRALAFNRNGIPIGQVLLPGREDGHNLHSTSLAIRPGTRDLYAVTSDGNGGQGAAIFRARVFGQGLSAVRDWR